MDTEKIVLLVGIIVAACAAALSLLLLLRSERKTPAKPAYKMYELQMQGNELLDDKAMQHIEKQITDQFDQVIHDATKRLKQSLNQTLSKVEQEVNNELTGAATEEFANYRKSVTALTKQNNDQLASLQKDFDTWRQSFSVQLEQTMAQERARTAEELDRRINDVVSSYLLEALGSNVDLGAQAPYIMQALDAHKEDIKKDIVA